MTSRSLCFMGAPSLCSLHLNPDAMKILSRRVDDSPSGLRSHIGDNQTSLAVPCLNGLYDIPVGRQLRPIWRNVMDRPLHLIQNEHGPPSMMVNRLFLAC